MLRFYIEKLKMAQARWKGKSRRTRGAARSGTGRSQGPSKGHYSSENNFHRKVFDHLVELLLRRRALLLKIFLFEAQLCELVLLIGKLLRIALRQRLFLCSAFQCFQVFPQALLVVEDGARFLIAVFNLVVERSDLI